jgi:NACHT domain
MDQASKRNHIESIDDEVNTLHPLLESIFQKFPGVVRVEYTHGKYERGADFLVEKEDPGTKRRRIIGVVVKAGRISPAKMPEIEEQIRECGEHRHYKVMEKVSCSEVWVFASGGFTERSKEKAAERFSNMTVEFFDAGDIVGFVDDHAAFLWGNLPYGLSPYYQSLTEKLNQLDQATAITVAINQAPYIELDVYERVRKTYTNQTSTKPEIRAVNLMSVLRETKVALLEAEMGFGKSRLARRIANQLASADSFHTSRLIPAFATCKSYLSEYGGSLEQLVAKLIPNHKQVAEDDKVTILVILDGLDECNGGDKKSEIFEQILAQAKVLAKVNVLITSRPIRALEERAAIHKEARTFGIRPLSLHKMVKYLEAACMQSNLPKRMYEDLKRSALFKQLPHSPIAAALFSNLMTRDYQEVPQSLTELYAKSMELMLGRWDQKKGHVTEKQFVTSQLIVENIAAYFLENRLIYLSIDEAHQLVKEYLNKRQTGISFNEIKDVLFDKGLLFNVDDEANTISFRHRSFAEFFCAKKKERDRSLSVKETALSSYWTNVFFFYSGLRQDCPELLEELQNIKTCTEEEEWMRVLAVPNYLLAAFATEFQSVVSNVRLVFLDVAKLYLRIRNGDTKTALTSLSEMHLLYLFKSVVVQNLGYSFFKPAFESCFLDIAESLEDYETKTIAQFFLGCVELDQGTDQVFQFLVKDKKAGPLPLSVSLGIVGELEGSTSVTNSPLLKYHREKLRKQFMPEHKATKQSTASVQMVIDGMYKKPIATTMKAIAGKSKQSG